MSHPNLPEKTDYKDILLMSYEQIGKISKTIKDVASEVFLGTTLQNRSFAQDKNKNKEPINK